MNNDGYVHNEYLMMNGVILDIETKMMVWMNKGLIYRWDNGWNDE